MRNTDLAAGGPCSTWDYSGLAATYDLRPDYSDVLLNDVMNNIGLRANDVAVDVGAGTGKLTRILCRKGLKVIAIEPNAAMIDIALPKPDLLRVQWITGTGESLPLRDRSARLVSYGSSFNVIDQRTALDECARVLESGGYWMAVWNHRDLDDPLQKAIESAIRNHLPDYEYGSRRESPVSALSGDPRFAPPRKWEGRFVATIDADEWLAAWRSHATLRRQAGPHFPQILESIAGIVGNREALAVPYFTRLWTAQRIAS